jgi:hypothetical protein
MTTNKKHHAFIESLINLDEDELIAVLAENEDKISQDLMDTLVSLSNDEDEEKGQKYQQLLDKIASFIFISELGSMINQLNEAETPQEQRAVLVDNIDLIVPEAIMYFQELCISLKDDPDDTWMTLDQSNKYLAIMKPLAALSEVLEKIDEALDDEDELSIKEELDRTDKKAMKEYLEIWRDHYQINADEEQVEIFEYLIGLL